MVDISYKSQQNQMHHSAAENAQNMMRQEGYFFDNRLFSTRQNNTIQVEPSHHCIQVLLQSWTEAAVIVFRNICQEQTA